MNYIEYKDIVKSNYNATKRKRGTKSDSSRKKVNLINYLLVLVVLISLVSYLSLYIIIARCSYQLGNGQGQRCNIDRIKRVKHIYPEISLNNQFISLNKYLGIDNGGRHNKNEIDIEQLILQFNITEHQPAIQSKFIQPSNNNNIKKRYDINILIDDKSTINNNNNNQNNNNNFINNNQILSTITNIKDSTYHHPKVSIVVPFYNQIEYLPITLDSIVKQTFKDYEVIIVDDSSTVWNINSTLTNIFNSYSHLMNLTIIFQNNNYGLSTSRNNGISIASGDWILPLDGDDLINSTLLEKSMNLISYHKINPQNNQNEIIISKLVGFVNDGKTNIPSYWWEMPVFSREKLKKKNMFHCSALFPKSMWSKVNGYDPSLWFGWEDWDFWIRVDQSLIHGITPRLVNEYLFEYRMKPGMHSFCSDNYDLCFSMFQTLHPHLYPIKDILLAHKRIGVDGKKIILPILERLKKYPNNYNLRLWLGLAFEYGYKNKNQAKQQYQIASKYNEKGELVDWQSSVLKVLIDRGTNQFTDSKRQLVPIFQHYPHLEQSLKNMYGDIFSISTDPSNQV